jgi:hypothetical protein
MQVLCKLKWSFYVMTHVGHNIIYNAFPFIRIPILKGLSNPFQANTALPAPHKLLGGLKQRTRMKCNNNVKSSLHS